MVLHGRRGARRQTVTCSIESWVHNRIMGMAQRAAHSDKAHPSAGPTLPQRLSCIYRPVVRFSLPRPLWPAEPLANRDLWMEIIHHHLLGDLARLLDFEALLGHDASLLLGRCKHRLLHERIHHTEFDVRPDARLVRRTGIEEEDRLKVAAAMAVGEAEEGEAGLRRRDGRH